MNTLASHVVPGTRRPCNCRSDVLWHALGNLWDFFEEGWCVAIPVNIGFTEPKHLAVMGAGLAKQAADRFPELKAWYGGICFRLSESVGVVQWPDDKRLLLVPTKPLDPAHPNLSWKQKSDPQLIRRSLKQLATDFLGGVAVPLLGCGCGELDPKDVLPMMGEVLSDKFVLVEPRRR